MTELVQRVVENPTDYIAWLILIVLGVGFLIYQLLNLLGKQADNTASDNDQVKALVDVMGVLATNTSEQLKTSQRMANTLDEMASISRRQSTMLEELHSLTSSTNRHLRDVGIAHRFNIIEKNQKKHNDIVLRLARYVVQHIESKKGASNQ